MIYLSVREVAALLGIGERSVQKNATEGVYGDIRYEEGTLGRGGRTMRIPLSGLPAAAQITYLQRLNGGPALGSDLSDESDAQRRKVEKKQKVLAAWRAYRQQHEGTAPAREIDKAFIRLWKSANPEDELKFSVATLHRWDKAERESGARGLVDTRGQHRAGESSIPEHLWDIFRSMYLTQQRRTLSDCYQFVKDYVFVNRLPDEVPHESAFRRRVEREFDKGTLVFLRKGVKAWMAECGPYVDQDHAAYAPGALYVMDHFQLDIACRDERGRPIRPWLSVMQDFRTRMFVGWAVTDRPTTESTMAAFARAALNPLHGIPDLLKLDNGREYTGYSYAGRGHRKASYKLDFDEGRVKSLVSHLGIGVIFTLPEHPQGKGELERPFRKIHEEFCKSFSSYLGNCPENRPEDAERIRRDVRNLKTLLDIDRLVTDYIINVHNETPHSAADMKGLSPRQMYEEEAHRRPVRHVDRDVLKLLFMPYAAGRLFTVDKGGIKVWGHRYWSKALYNMQGQKVQVRYDPSDVGRVWVFDAQGRFVDAPEAENPALPGQSADTAKRITRIRSKLQKELRQTQRDLQRFNEDEILAVRSKAGELRREAEREATPQARRVTQIHPVDSDLLRAAKDVERARKEIAAAQEEAAAAKERIDFMAVINGIPLPSENRPGPSEDARRFLQAVPRRG